MRITGLQIENCKSYLEPTDVPLDPYFNVFVGPNGGGKSNTLDIINVVLRHSFLWAYQRQVRGQPPNQEHDIRRQDPFSNIDQYLDAHVGYEDRPTEIVLQLEVGPSDVENVNRVFDHRDALRRELARYQNTPHGGSELGALGEDSREQIREGDQHEFVVRNGALDEARLDRSDRAYLNLN